MESRASRDHQDWLAGAGIADLKADDAWISIRTQPSPAVVEELKRRHSTEDLIALAADPVAWNLECAVIEHGPAIMDRHRNSPAPPKEEAAPAADFEAATLDLAALDGRTPPPRRFAWEPWVPANEVTLLHGYGGVGKTLLVQQLATATAIGAALFGGQTEPGPVLVLAGEDSREELWRRQIDICQRLGCTLQGLAPHLRLIAAPHLDITIAESSESGAVQPTATFSALQELIERIKPRLVVLDNSAKLFAAKEADRIAVTRCVRLLHSLCHDFDTTVVLVAHNNKLGEFSGSTAWENACRSRLHLAREDDGETITLKMPKANYAALGEIKLRWDRGSFRCEEEAGMNMAERLGAEQERRQHAETFLVALDALTEQGRAVSHSSRAANYAPKVMATTNLVGDLTKKQLEAAMELLFAEGRIVANSEVGKRANRSPLLGIARAPSCCTQVLIRTCVQPPCNSCAPMCRTARTCVPL